MAGISARPRLATVEMYDPKGSIKIKNPEDVEALREQVENYSSIEDQLDALLEADEYISLEEQMDALLEADKIMGTATGPNERVLRKRPEKLSPSVKKRLKNYISKQPRIRFTEENIDKVINLVRAKRADDSSDDDRLVSDLALDDILAEMLDLEEVWAIGSVDTNKINETLVFNEHYLLAVENKKKQLHEAQAGGLDPNDVKQKEFFKGLMSSRRKINLDIAEVAWRAADEFRGLQSEID